MTRGVLNILYLERRNECIGGHMSGVKSFQIKSMCGCRRVEHEQAGVQH